MKANGERQAMIRLSSLFPNESEKVFNRYFERKVKPQVRELVTEFGPIGIFWLDTYGHIRRAESQELKEMIRELQPKRIINERIGNRFGDYKIWLTLVASATGFLRSIGTRKASATAGVFADLFLTLAWAGHSFWQNLVAGVDDGAMVSQLYRAKKACPLGRRQAF